MPTALGTVASHRTATAVVGPPTSGMLAWWDASDDASFTYFTSNQVSQWKDKSLNSNHASVIPFSSSSWYATRVANAINGLPAISFNPGAFDTPVSATLKPFTIMAALKTGPNTGTTAIIGRPYSNGSNGTGYIELFLTNGVHTLQNHFVVNVGVATAPCPANTPIVTGVSYGSNNVCEHYLNGAVNGSTVTDTTFTAVGNTMGLGAQSVPDSGRYDGLFGEVLIYNRVLTTVERQQVESYLRNKWIITPNNPLTFAPWHAAYWASDPAWTPPADGAAVTTWRDGSGYGRTMTMNNGPLYRAASSVLNNKPGIEFDGVNDTAQSATFSNIGPVTAVAVLRPTQVTTQGYWMSVPTLGGAYIDASAWGMYAGAVLSGGVANTSRHLVTAYFNDSASVIKVDGVQVASGAAGSNAATASNWQLGAWANLGTAYGANTYGFVGFKQGALTAAEEADLLAWSRSFYGTP